MPLFGVVIKVNALTVKLKGPPPTVREYGCEQCQCFHRQTIDPEYEAHLAFAAKHCAPYDRPASIGERFVLEMETNEPRPMR